MTMMWVFALLYMTTCVFAVEIFVGTQKELWRCPEDTMQACNQIPVTVLNQVVAIDIDLVEGYIYWSDWTDDTISRARLDGAEQKVLFSGVGSLGIRLDVESRLLFWTNCNIGTIERSLTDGSKRTVLVRGLGANQSQVWAIALDTTATPPMMYWTTVNPGRIERADYNGGRRQLLVTSDLRFPEVFTLDTTLGKMYWADSVTGRLEVAGLDGSGRTRLLDNQQYISIDLYGDQLYLADDYHRHNDGYKASIKLYNKSTGNTVVLRNVDRMSSIRVVGKRSYTTPVMTTKPTTTSTRPTTTSTTPTTTSTTPTTTSTSPTTTVAATPNRSEPPCTSFPVVAVVVGVSAGFAVIAVVIAITAIITRRIMLLQQNNRTSRVYYTEGHANETPFQEQKYPVVYLSHAIQDRLTDRDQYKMMYPSTWQLGPVPAYDALPPKESDNEEVVIK